MQLSLSTWAEVEAYLAQSDGIIVPIGSTEQHGPNGLIGTDAICAEAVARGVGEETGALVAPVMAIGMAQHHLAFPGSITLRPSTMIAYVSDTVFSLARHGFRRFMFINGHGGNIAPLSAAFSELYATASLDPSGTVPRLRCTLRNWFDGPEVGRLSREFYGDRLGSHATPSEVALTQFLHPQAIKQAAMPPVTPTRRRFTDALDLRALHPDGRIGSEPGLATPEHGRVLYEAAVRECAAAWRSFAAEA
ncbi:MAG: creatininase family protein [Acetobacteraceae bacterium]|jgi:creatinine amidohydrolase|nr:creatininase family protein [Acetobacteraceae bacterium]